MGNEMGNERQDNDSRQESEPPREEVGLSSEDSAISGMELLEGLYDATANGHLARAPRAGTAGAIVSDDALRAHHEVTTLDRVHAAMLLQKSGRANALRALLKAEQDRGSDFLRLANALSAMYPRDSEEKRLVDAMLLAVPR